MFNLDESTDEMAIAGMVMGLYGRPYTSQQPNDFASRTQDRLKSIEEAVHSLLGAQSKKDLENAKRRSHRPTMQRLTQSLAAFRSMKSLMPSQADARKENWDW
mmetsp:Transcript_2281/g.6630  ORF Transcript_2281/g.6630 Transcript_2281/m.6630 type:complete len:103 (+) Transcript_2281:2571-2879(+)